MERQDTDSIVRVWVDEFVQAAATETSAWVQGLTFFGGYGLGQRDGRPVSVYEGQAALITSQSRQIRRCSLGSVHVSRIGSVWSIDGPLPELPFLVTNELETKCLYSGTAVFRLTEKLESIISGDEFPPVQIAVQAPDWYGIITVDDVSKPDVGRLDAFSTKPGARVAPDDRMVVLEMDDDDTEFGTITRLADS